MNHNHNLETSTTSLTAKGEKFNEKLLKKSTKEDRIKKILGVTPHTWNFNILSTVNRLIRVEISYQAPVLTGVDNIDSRRRKDAHARMVYERVKFIRESLGLTQNEFANVIGINVYTYGAAERSMTFHSFGMIVNICEQLEIPIEVLVSKELDWKHSYSISKKN